MTTGYDGPQIEDEEKVKDPEDCKWDFITEQVGQSEYNSEVLYVLVKVDGESIGSIRLPNSEYLRYLREMFQTKEKENGSLS